MVQSGKIHLHILDHHVRDGQRESLHHADHLLHIGLERGRQSSTPLACCSVEEALGSVPFALSPTPAMSATGIHLLFDISPMLKFG